ncbi:hypothetical protein CI41S_67910 [Bradyrhizobium ivorense]|nr:hypothetical protein CI41S_67910 [Bradyrhizobium ivorense]
MLGTRTREVIATVASQMPTARGREPPTCMAILREGSSPVRAETDPGLGERQRIEPDRRSRTRRGRTRCWEDHRRATLRAEVRALPRKREYGVCRLTGQLGKFVKAHLLPKALTRPGVAGTPFVEMSTHGTGQSGRGAAGTTPASSPPTARRYSLSSTTRRSPSCGSRSWCGAALGRCKACPIGRNMTSVRRASACAGSRAPTAVPCGCFS